MQDPEATRAYDASGRREQAVRRRDEVIDIAAELFGDRGFEAATFGQIADAAGVSVAYLQSLGTKAELFLLAVDRRATGGRGTLAGEGDDLTLAAVALPPREALELLVHATAQWNAGSHRLWRAWTHSSDPDLNAAWDASMAGVRTAYRAWIDRLEESGERRADVSAQEQAAAVWLLTLADTYDRLVRIAGLTHEQYVQWLSRSLRELVLAAP